MSSADDEETREYLRKSGVAENQLDRGVAMVNELLAGPPALPRRTLFLQWKGTEACLDFECACGISFHFDGHTFGGLKCVSCGRCYRIEHDIPVTLVEPTDWHGVDLTARWADDEHTEVGPDGIPVWSASGEERRP